MTTVVLAGSESRRPAPSRKSSIYRFLHAHVMERTADPALRVFGACLALVNALTALFWFVTQRADLILSSPDAICWPLFQGCAEWRLPGPASKFAIMAFGLASMWVAVEFATPARNVTAYIALLITTVGRFALIALDYRLALNQHYMAGWAIMGYLLAPLPRLSLRYLLVMFYVAASSLKWNTAWLSGQALYGLRPFGMPDSWIPAACAYVIALECIVVWGLLAKRTWLFLVCLGQVVLFHISSFWVVGYFYPIEMFLLLSLFPISRRFPNDAVPRAGGWTIWHRIRAWSLPLLFASFQVIPLVIPGNAAVTGEGRMFALNMFDAPTRCVAHLTPTGREPDPSTRLLVPFLENRIACDPLVYLEAARRRCERSWTVFTDYDLRLDLEDREDSVVTPLVDIHGVCRAAPVYRLLGRNAWINSAAGTKQ